MLLFRNNRKISSTKNKRIAKDTGASVASQTVGADLRVPSERVDEQQFGEVTGAHFVSDEALHGFLDVVEV